VDERGRKLCFRDITGNDLEYLDSLFDTDNETVSGSDISGILEHLCVRPLRAGRLTPRTIRSLYHALREHILCNYMSKETWLKQCYSIQNGSFQGVREMEFVPMSKFTAMCMIHKEAMDQMKNENADPDPIHS
jgi:hypothetical protein